jgi:hypothetical protein
MSGHSPTGHSGSCTQSIRGALLLPHPSPAALALLPIFGPLAHSVEHLTRAAVHSLDLSANNAHQPQETIGKEKGVPMN